MGSVASGVGSGAPLRVPLAPESHLRREWAVVSLGPHLAACLAGWEQTAPGARTRAFEAVWTTTLPVVRYAAEVPASCGAAAQPDLVDRVLDATASWAPDSGDGNGGGPPHVAGGGGGRPRSAAVTAVALSAAASRCGRRSWRCARACRRSTHRGVGGASRPRRGFDRPASSSGSRPRCGLPRRARPGGSPR